MEKKGMYLKMKTFQVKLLRQSWIALVFQAVTHATLFHMPFLDRTLDSDVPGNEASPLYSSTIDDVGNYLAKIKGFQKDHIMAELYQKLISMKDKSTLDKAMTFVSFSLQDQSAQAAYRPNMQQEVLGTDTERGWGPLSLWHLD